MKKLLSLLLLIINLQSLAQKKLQGQYYYRKTEMAAGFNFLETGKFAFFFSYGAVDRSATGTFKITGDTLLFYSDKEPGKDFSIVSQAKQEKGYSITFTHPNKYLLQHIRCSFVTDGRVVEAITDANGEINMDIAHCDTIYVQHLLYPDIATIIKDAANENNRFTLSLNPSLEQVSFKDIYFNIVTDKIITCTPNYFFTMPVIRFEKE